MVVFSIYFGVYILGKVSYSPLKADFGKNNTFSKNIFNKTHGNLMSESAHTLDE